jgi:hypothetical protein
MIAAQKINKQPWLDGAMAYIDAHNELSYSLE